MAKKQPFYSLLILSALCLSSSFALGQNSNKLSQFVNPFIGTGGHGHTFPGAIWPMGMVQLSPDTRNDNSWDGCSGYHYSDTSILGFSHTHLSGTGCSDWGDILLMPTQAKEEITTNKYASTFKHKNEQAAAGYYKVLLDKHKITAELTATQRVGIHKYTYSNANKKYLIVDLVHRDEVLDSEFEVVYPNRLRGYRKSKAWANKQIVYFDIVFNQDIKEIYFLDNDTINKHPYAKRKKLKALIAFHDSTGTTLQCKVALSSVNNEGAMANLDAEAKHNNFEQYKEAATNAWNQRLACIEVFGGTTEQKTNFYTALYHCFTHPSMYADVTGKYRGMDDAIHTSDNKTFYNVFSLWDTYRALHPLLTITDTKLAKDLCATIAAQSKAAKRTPVWELSNCETNCMIAYHGVSVLYDAYQKGIRTETPEELLELMLSSATENKPGVNSINQYGYIRSDDDAESVSKTLEYAYDDWCIAQVASDIYNTLVLFDSVDQYAVLRYDSIATEFIQRSYAWIHILDPETKFMRPVSNGTWLQNFSPYRVDNNFTEANSWQYSFYAPQHINTLMYYHGGVDSFEKHLDNLFAARQQTEGREQADITGLIGQYAHGNEPSHHIAWLYHYVGKTQKLQEKVNFILNNFYKNAPDGLIGNEDCGQMSAWYVLSSIGIYPICPGNGQYATCAPLWDSVRINNNGKKTVLIKNSKKIAQAATLDHATLSQATSIVLPQQSNMRPLAIPQQVAMPNPVIRNAKQIFADSQLVEMTCLDADARIFYTINNDAPRMYVGPFYIDKRCTIRFYSARDNLQSKTQEAHFFILPKGVRVNIASTYNKSYSGGGDAALVDGLLGKEEWRTGLWQGYQSQDFEATITFDKAKQIDSVGCRFLSDQKSWIFLPKNCIIEYSTDGKQFQKLCSFTFDTKRDDDRNFIVQKIAQATVNGKSIAIKSLRYKATNYGVLPSWHPGAGGDAFIFLDEVLFTEKQN
ncbi:MAG: hypothetical protein RL660_1245 [Bacteroidota bacterium]|jgi:predicted alpha-1,2-mannosidase